jgi:hypothetical protein
MLHLSFHSGEAELDRESSILLPFPGLDSALGLDLL